MTPEQIERAAEAYYLAGWYPRDPVVAYADIGEIAQRACRVRGQYIVEAALAGSAAEYRCADCGQPRSIGSAQFCRDCYRARSSLPPRAAGAG